MIGSGTVIVIFVVLVFTNVLLAVEVYNNTNSCRELKSTQQDKVQRAAQLYVQSQTQNRTTLAREDIIRAQVLIEDIKGAYGGIVSAEKALKLQSGSLESLERNVRERSEKLRIEANDAELLMRPELACEFDKMAGLGERKNLKKKKKKKKSRRHERPESEDE